MSCDDGVSTPPHVVVEFGHDSSASRVARHALRPFLRAEDPIAEAVRLVASELVSNVIRHTAGGGMMRVWDLGPPVPLRLEVTDAGAGEPAPPAPGQPVGVGGRGLRLVAGMSDYWGVIQHDVGKTVWAEFCRLS